MAHTSACGASKRKKCICQCGGKHHGELVKHGDDEKLGIPELADN